MCAVPKFSPNVRHSWAVGCVVLYNISCSHHRMIVPANVFLGVGADSLFFQFLYLQLWLGFFPSTAFCLSVPVFFSLEERNDRRWAFIFVTKWGSWLCVSWPNHFRRKKRIEQTKHAYTGEKKAQTNQRGALACWLYFSRVLIVSEIHKFFYRHRFSLENFEKLVVAPNIFILKKGPR